MGKQVVTLEVRRASEHNEGWCVALNGTDVVGFSGPDARNRAEHHKEELATLLNAREAAREKLSNGNR